MGNCLPPSQPHGAKALEPWERGRPAEGGEQVQQRRPDCASTSAAWLPAPARHTRAALPRTPWASTAVPLPSPGGLLGADLAQGPSPDITLLSPEQQPVALHSFLGCACRPGEAFNAAQLLFFAPASGYVEQISTLFPGRPLVPEQFRRQVHVPTPKALVADEGLPGILATR